MKYIKLSILAVAMSTMVVACGNNESNDTNDAPAQTTQQAPPAAAPAPPAEDPNTEVEVDLNTPAGDVKVKTER